MSAGITCDVRPLGWRSLGLRPPPGPQRWRMRRAGHRLDQQGCDGHGERARHSFERGDGHILRAALDAADIGPVDAGRKRKTLLRQSPRDPQRSQIPADDRPRFHGANRPDQRLGNRRTNSPAL